MSTSTYHWEPDAPSFADADDIAAAERLAAAYSYGREIDGEWVTFGLDPRDALQRQGNYTRTVSTDASWSWTDDGDAIASVLSDVKHRANGRPMHWAMNEPADDEHERSNVKVGHGKRGQTRKVVRHGRTMVTYNGIRMSTSTLASIATAHARMSCLLCVAVWDACEDERHERDEPSDGSWCSKCATGCECMPDVLGGDRVSWAQVIHAGIGRTSPCAAGTSSILEAYGDIVSGLDRDERAEVRDVYVSQSGNDRRSGMVANGKTVGTALRWPTRFAPSAGWTSWRNSERDSFTLTEPIVNYWHAATGPFAPTYPTDHTAAIIDRVTLLPSHDDNGGRFVGHVHHDERGALASRKARNHDNGAREHRNAVNAGRLASEVALNMLAVGESTIVDDVRIDRLASTTYRVAGSDKRPRTLTAALKLAHAVALASVDAPTNETVDV